MAGATLVQSNDEDTLWELWGGGGRKDAGEVSGASGGRAY
jgi:hypothetical protein